ncbi:sensor histidine kinase [Viridibacillus sp. NPDC096237]|uniref:sensor histidine kinase n=1 Tax=Viridibacillus sp. NPDC096237 TaxID=3390721 RepID=UPI003D047C09
MRSLYFKFIMLTIGIMLLSGVLSFFISNTYYQQKLKPFNDAKNTQIALDIAEFAEKHPTTDLKDYLENLSFIGYQLYLVDTSRKGTYFGADFRVKELPNSTIDQVLNNEIYHGLLHFPQETFVTGFFANELKNTIGVPLTHDNKQYALFLRPDIKLLFNEMHILFGWLFALTIILSILMVLISTKYLVKPITKLTKATNSLAEGKFNVELDINRSDELGKLANSFSHMANKLEQFDDIRKEFISNISHDIQSPLSNIKGYTNLLGKDELPSEDKEKYIAVINGEIERLSTLTKQLLLLSSLDQNEDIMKKKSFNVAEQIKELVRQYQWAIGEKGIMLSYSLPDFEIVGDPLLLNTVWDNLLTNAIKYNKENGSIDIAIAKNDSSIIVTFQDKGIGLSEKEIDRIFDRFYRVDSSRTHSVEGSGLGLSIVSSIIKLHNGKIDVISEENKGTIFSVTLPIQ